MVWTFVEVQPQSLNESSLNEMYKNFMPTHVYIKIITNIWRVISISDEKDIRKIFPKI